MKRDYIYGGVFLILILIMWLNWEEKSKEHSLKVEQLNDRNRIINQQKDSLKAVGLIAKESWHEDSLNMAKSRETAKKEAKYWHSVAITRRSAPEVQQAIDSIPQVAAAFNADDSLTLAYMHEIDTLENQLTRQYDNFKVQLVIKDRIIKALETGQSNSNEIIKEQEKALKRSRRISRLSVGMGACFIIGVLVVL